MSRGVWWSADEGDALRAHWDSSISERKNAYRIGKRLDRTEDSVARRAKRLGLFSTWREFSDQDGAKLHAEACVGAGGFPTLIERRDAKGRPAGFLMQDGCAVWAWPASEQRPLEHISDPLTRVVRDLERKVRA